MGVIYKISNIIDDRVYIGSSVNYSRRHKEHLNDLNKGKHHNVHLQRFYNKYGHKSLVFDIIEECDDKIILEREQKFLDSELHLFNISSDASAPMTGRSHSNKTRKHFSNIRVGEGNPMFGKKRAKHVVEAMQENRWANGMKKKERVLRRINRKLRKEVIIEKDNKSIRCLSTAHASNIIGVASTTVADAIRSGRLKSKGWNIIVCNDKKYSEEFVLKHIELFDGISFYPKPELVEMLKNL